MCLQIYQDEGDDGFEAADQAITNLVARFKDTEERRIEGVEKRETTRHPNDNRALSNMMCKSFEVTRPQGKTNPPGPKRQRSSSRGPPNKRGRSSNSRTAGPPSDARPSRAGPSRNPPKGKSRANTAPQGRAQSQTYKGQSRANASKGKTPLSLTAEELMKAMETLQKAAQQLQK